MPKTTTKNASKSETIKSAPTKDIEENKTQAIIAYVGNIIGLPLFLIPIITKKDSPFAMFHAKQAMVIFLGNFILGFGGLTVAAVLTVFLVGILLFPLVGLILLGFFVLNIMGLISGSNGEMKKLPIVGDLADKIKF